MKDDSTRTILKVLAVGGAAWLSWKTADELAQAVGQNTRASMLLAQNGSTTPESLAASDAANRATVAWHGYAMGTVGAVAAALLL